MYASEVLAETPGWSGKVTERGMARSDTPCGTDAGFESVKRVAHRELRRFARKAPVCAASVSREGAAHGPRFYGGLTCES